MRLGEELRATAQISAAKTIFQPLSELQDPLLEASEQLRHTFENWHMMMLQDKNIGKTSIVPLLTDLIAKSAIYGYGSGGLVTSKMASRLRNSASSRALEVSRSVTKTSRKLYKSDSDYVFTPLRATRIVNYEAQRGYFYGLQQRYKGSGVKKSWITLSEHPCDICTDAEDMGKIDFDELYDHGEGFPPAHLSCNCTIQLDL